VWVSCCCCLFEKHYIIFGTFFSEIIILEILWVKNSEQLMQENDILRNSTFSIISQHYVDDFLGPEEMKDTCGKTVHVGRMDRSFTLLGHVFTMIVSCLPLTMEVWVQSQAGMWKLWLTKWHWDRLPSKYFNISYEWLMMIMMIGWWVETVAGNIVYEFIIKRFVWWFVCFY